MPPSKLPEFIKRLTVLEGQMKDHLVESVGIKSTLLENSTDLKWIKKAFWVLAGAGVTFNVTLVVGVALLLLKRMG